MPRSWWRTLAVLLAAGAIAIACASPEERFAEHVARADSYLEKDNKKEALIEFRNALKINPKSAEINERIADLLVSMNRFDDGAFYYRETYRLDPDNIEAAMSEARLLLFRDRERAREIITEGLEKAPDNPTVHLAQSELALVMNDSAGALEAALVATKLDPNSEAIWAQLGKVHQARIREHRLQGTRPDDKIFEDAIAAFDRADEVAKGSVGAEVEKARVLAAWPGRLDEADAAFRKAVELAIQFGESTPILVAANAARGFASASGRHDLHIWALRKMVETDPNAIDLWIELAAVSQGTPEASGGGRAVYQELIALRPDDPRVHSAYAMFLVRNDDPDEAIRHLSETIDKGVDDAELMEQLVRIQLQRGRIRDALAAYDRMQSIHAHEIATERVGTRLALAQGRPAEAAETLRSLAGRVDSFETLRLLALAEFKLGNTEAATSAIDRALSMSPGFSADAVHLKARIHNAAHDWDQALRSFRVLIGRGERLTPEERLMRARALYETGRVKTGREVLRQLIGDPDAPPATAVEFAHYEGQRNPRAARLLLEAALKKAPGRYDLLKELTELDVREKRVREAVQRLNQAIAAGNVGPRVVLLRGQLFARMNMLDRAEADALRSFEAAPDLAGTVDLLFAVYSAQGRLDEARRSFEEAEAAGVLHRGARILLARIYMNGGDSDKARAMLEKVLEDDPGNAGAKNDLAFLLAERGEQLDRALQLAKDAQQVLTKDPNAADTAGYVYYRKGLHEAAVQQISYAIELSGQTAGGVNPTFEYHLGLALQALGRSSEAASAFERALAIRSDFANADDARRQLEAARAAAPEVPSTS